MLRLFFPSLLVVLLLGATPLTAQVDKIVLHEIFCASSLFGCGPSNQHINGLLDLWDDNTTRILYPTDFPGVGDPYHTPDAEIRRAFYDVTSIPRMQVDGDYDDTPINYTQDSLDERIQAPGEFELVSDFFVVDSTFLVNAAITPLRDFPSNDLRVHLAVVEKETTGNVGTNGESVFYYVLKKMIPDGHGTAIPPLDSSITQDINFPAYTVLPGSTVEQINNLRFIVFVQDHVTKEVLQSTISWAVMGTEGVSGLGPKARISVFPNPLQEQATLSLHNFPRGIYDLHVANAQGQLMRSERLTVFDNHQDQVLNVSDFSSGIYLVRVAGEGRTLSTRISIR